MAHLTLKSRTNRRALLAVITAFLLFACSDPATQSAAASYPTFSFVGAPNREITYDLSITAPDMRPIELTDIGPTTGSVRVEVPAGPDRLIDMRARNDIYSGSTTRTLRAGRTENVRLHLLPGPVFVDRGGAGESDPGVIQVRDLGVPVESVFDGESGLGRFAPFDGPVHLETGFTADGTLWSLVDSEVATIEVYGAWEDLVNGSFENPIDLAGLDLDAIAADISTSHDWIAVGGVHDQDEGIALFDDAGNRNDNFRSEPEFQVASASGLAFGGSDLLFAVGEIIHEGNTLVAIARFDIANDTEDHRELPGNQSAPEYDDGLNPPWADVRVIGSNVFVVSAAAGDGDASVYHFDLDLNLLGQWGNRTNSGSPDSGEFWGPRRFVATRRENELIVIDQKDDDQHMSPDPELDGTGRLVRFEFDSNNGWQVFGEGDFGFFDTRFDTGVSG